MPETVLLAGASGFLGSSIAPFLGAGGYRLRFLVRDKRRCGENSYYWDPQIDFLDIQALEGVSTVINLCGENIASGLWTKTKKASLTASRVRPTSLIASALASLTDRKTLLVNASATGFYGSRGDEILTEQSGFGEGFLASLTRQWEEATAPASRAGHRVVNARFGVVLSAKGGMLSRIRMAFSMGLGGRLGSGKQYVSWIALADLMRAVQHVIASKEIEGPVNFTSPNPVTNAELTELFAASLGRKEFLGIPEFALRLLPGGMGKEMLLSSTRAVPKALLESGFVFEHPTIAMAL